jgi:hypothetical protein
LPVNAKIVKQFHAAADGRVNAQERLRAIGKPKSKTLAPKKPKPASKRTDPAVSVFNTTVMHFGRDKAALATASRMAQRLGTTTLSYKETHKRVTSARKKLTKAPIGSAIRLAPGQYLKKYGPGDYRITSLQ